MLTKTELIRLHGPWCPVYSHVLPDGTNVHIYAEGIRQWINELDHTARQRLTRGFTPVDPRIAYDWVQTRVVSARRLMDLTPAHRTDPVIYAQWEPEGGAPGEMLLLDGHHRYVRAAMDSRTFIDAFLLSPPQWRPFEVSGMEDLTAHQLLSFPNLRRTY